MDVRGGAGAEGQRVVRLANRYTLGDRLGGGGMAVVYRAFDERLHRDVAIKLLAPSPGLDGSARARFESEARAAASINHPRVVAVYDVGTEDEQLFIVMECLRGLTLADELRETGPMPVDRVITVLTDVLDGLEAAHTTGVLHRDIKPSNVLFDVDGRAKLADFGIATSGRSDLTETGVVVGTPAYLAPERIAGRPATTRSDLYAVGVVAYEALAGIRPFGGETPFAVVRAIDEGRPVPLGDVHADVPAAVANAVMGAMAVDPEQRPASAAAFARALDATRVPTSRPVDAEAAVTTLPAVPLRDDAPTARLPRSVDDTPPASASTPARRLIVFVLVGAVAIGLVLGTLWSAFRDDDDSPPPSSSVTTTPQPSVPEPLENAFDRLEEVVQP